MIYLDTSAFLKTMIDEPQSAALAHVLGGRGSPRFVSSTLLAVEARGGARCAPTRIACLGSDLALLRVAQIEMDGPVVETASRLPDPMLRTLDAIHLATALLIRDDVEVLVSYDQRMLAAAAAHGLPTARPLPDVRAVPDSDFPADPYPGAVPPFSFVHLDEHSHPLTFDVCWRVGGGASLTCGSPDTVRPRSRRGSPCCPTARTATPARSPGCAARWG